MVTQVRPDLGEALSRQFSTIADDARVTRTAKALEANGITVLRASDRVEAKRIVLDLIPEGSEVHQGTSETLVATGITDEIEKSGRYQAVRPRIRSMDRETQADEIRRLSAAPAVMLGSVHAVTETGSLLTASMGGSQLGPYASGAGQVILVVGTQKIVADLDEGMRRINEYSFPLEDARIQGLYGIHSRVNKVLIINGEITPGRITVVFVDEGGDSRWQQPPASTAATDRGPRAGRAGNRFRCADRHQVHADGRKPYGEEPIYNGPYVD